jgi:hypothetical protein
MAKKLMSSLSPETWRIKSQIPGRNENLLHFFIVKNFLGSLDFILKLDHPHISQMVVQRDAAGNTPLMKSLMCNQITTSDALWKVMKELDAGRLNQSLGSANKRKESVLHMCAQSRNNDILLEIISQVATHKTVLLRDGNKQTALDLCRDENTLLKIFHMISLEEVEDELKDCDVKGKNLLHHMGGKNFAQAINHLMKILPDKTFKVMISKPDYNSNNPVMYSALNCSKDSLMVLLLYIYLHSSNSLFFDEILHRKNVFNNTILSLVLQHNERLKVCKHIILEMEKKFHDVHEGTYVDEDKEINNSELINCMRNNLQPSSEVQRAIQNVNDTLPKDKSKRSLIWFKVFIKSLFLPVFLLFLDTFFDVVLVKWYKEHDDCLNHEFEWCKKALNMTVCLHDSTSATCDLSTQKMFFTCTPHLLTNASKFNYSLAFIISPWVFYFFEYTQSKYSEEYVKVI